MNFTAMMAALDCAVEDHLCDDGLLVGDAVGELNPPVGIRLMINHPVDIDRLQGMSITRVRPTVMIAHAAVPELREGHHFYLLDPAGQTIEAQHWAIASAPTRPGDGRWWQAEIEPAE